MSNSNLPSVTSAPASLLECRLDSVKYPRLRTYTKEEAVFHMSKIVTNALLYRGQQVDNTNVQFIASNLIDELYLTPEDKGILSLSFAEIASAIKTAVLGGSEMYGITVASLYKVIIEWAETEGIQLQIEANNKVRKERQNALKLSATGAMVQAMAGAMIKNQNKR